MWQIIKLFVVLAIVVTSITSNGLQEEVLFLIASQSTNYHRQLSAQLRNDIYSQYGQLANAQYAINVQLLDTEHWSPLTVLPKLSQSQTQVVKANTTKWLVWCEESTQVNVQRLLRQLAKRNHAEPQFLGYALRDREATIIHHFAFFEDPKWFTYPMLRSGVIFSIALYERLCAMLLNEAHHVTAKRTHFTIDVAHELSLLIYDNVRHVATNNNKQQTATTTTNATTAHATNATNVQRSKDNGQQRIDSNARINNANGTDGNVMHGDNNNNNDDVDDDDVGSNGELIRMQAGVQKPKTTTTTTRTQSPLPAPTPSTATTTSTTTSTTFGVRKILLQHTPFICPQAQRQRSGSDSGSDSGSGDGSKHCAMHAKPMDLTTCVAVQRACIYFAIKTCQRFHKERIPLLESTWTPFTVHKKYYSDVTDLHIPTTSTGVPNINVGHCAKTLAIFKLALKDIEQANQRQRQRQRQRREQNAAAIHHNAHIRWLFLADDDTLLSVARLTEFLGCFNASTSIYLGERYGYRLHARDGFSYITGGGGIALSVPALRLVVQHCSCPSASAPDDMILGACMQSLKIPAVHTARFHQARSMDYAPELLAVEAPITFHKFWQLDPLVEYARWFSAADRQMLLAEQQLWRSSHRLPNAVAANESQQHCSRSASEQRKDRRDCCSAPRLIPHAVAEDVQQTQRHIEL